MSSIDANGGTAGVSVSIGANSNASAVNGLLTATGNAVSGGLDSHVPHLLCKSPPILSVTTNYYFFFPPLCTTSLPPELIDPHLPRLETPFFPLLAPPVRGCHTFFMLGAGFIPGSLSHA
jgi:hypothetical protein